MARVRNISFGEANVRVHPSEVDCCVQQVEASDGTKYIHISTFGSDERVSRPKVSQTMQFDRQTALQLRAEIDRIFGVS